MDRHAVESLGRLQGLGVTWTDGLALRRISMTLHRWGELECGDESGRAIERDDVTGKPYITWEPAIGNGKRCRHPVADRETGALKRLAAIMARYPELAAYHQTDPRGAALYVGSKADMAVCYTRGIPVCK